MFLLKFRLTVSDAVKYVTRDIQLTVDICRRTNWETEFTILILLLWTSKRLARYVPVFVAKPNYYGPFSLTSAFHVSFFFFSSFARKSRKHFSLNIFCYLIAVKIRVVLNVFWQINLFVNRLNGEPVGVSVFGIFIIDKNAILVVR